MTATKEELQKELEGLGVKVDKRWKEERLTEVLDNTKAKLQAVEDNLTGKDKIPTDVLLEGAKRDGDDVKLKSGVLIPQSILQQMGKTRWVYFSEDSSEKSVVKKESGKYVQYVREYSLQIHGPNFQQLAHGFVDKNNLRPR